MFIHNLLKCTGRFQIKWDYKRQNLVPACQCQVFEATHTGLSDKIYSNFVTLQQASPNNILLNIIHGEEELDFQVTTKLRNIYILKVNSLSSFN
jgi:hypothetical protein